MEVKIFSLIQEKTEKVQELEALVETISRGKYMWESTFDAIKNPVMIVSSDYKILRANKAAAIASQIDVKQVINTTCYEVLAGRKIPCRGCPLGVTLRDKKPNTQKLDPFSKSGSQYEVNAYPLFDSKGERQVVLYYRDITEEKKLSDRLLHSEKMAAIGLLAGGVAHEINNPLGGILAFAQLAMRDLPEDHKTQSDLKEIEEAALRCKRIVQDLLDFSRQNREEVMGPVQLNDVLQKIIPLLKVQTRTSRIEMQCDLANNLPFIKGNFHKLQQVFLNLATNGYQAMGRGGELTIKTYYKKEGDRVGAEVSDSGPGIKPEDLSKIFDPYFTTKFQGEGTGLGLSITYGIVQEHHGEIDVRSEIGKGTTFVLSFPVLT